MRVLCVLCLLLSSPSAIGTLTHQGTFSATLQDQGQEDSRPDHQEAEPVAGLEENRSTMEEKIPSDPVVSSHHLHGDTTCFGRTLAHREVIDDMLSALRQLSVQERELTKEDLTRFGVCSDSYDNALVRALSTLVTDVNVQKHGLHVWQPTKEVTEGDKGLVLTLHLHQPPLLKVKPILLLAFRNPRSRALGPSTFTSHALQPYMQTVCISEGTQYLILTGTPLEGKGHLKWRVLVDNETSNTGQELAELKSILGEGTRSNVGVIPLMLFSMVRGTDDRLTDSPVPLPAPSGTYTFLCELQRFLSDVLLPLEQTQPPTAPVPLHSLHSLPPLSLGVSSSETILAEMINSSAPTLFSFPAQSSEFQDYRGELALQPALLEVLRQRLEEVVVQMRAEEVGSAGMDRLRRLQKLSFLPKDGEEPPKDDGSPGEMQYRALLLLKALQTVVVAWEVERGRRATRAGQEGPGHRHLCRLHSLTVSLEKYMLSPSEANIFDCHGVCSIPLTNGNNHAILLNQQDLPPEHSLCCVPVDYEDLRVVQLNQAGTEIIIKPAMVATKCGCR
ncbi:hypothetical protein DPEC_G00267780 [Dallia pectoralis]|uniref:Uncharacterized protein n=1 Tax=Dallia pectoralis TaxID=75939 RepID=A0ACC2FNV6_DALPE|nr:hypothetical protein DPEC_G00267780 [Dallia pectoralis]